MEARRIKTQAAPAGTKEEAASSICTFASASARPLAPESFFVTVAKARRLVSVASAKRKRCGDINRA